MGLFFFNIKRYVWQLIFCTLGIIIGVCCTTSLASIMANIIDVGVNNFDLKYIINHGLIMICLGLCAILCGAINIYFSAYVTQNCAFDLRKKVFDKIQEFEFKNINRFSDSSLITRVTDDVNNLQMTFMMMLRISLQALITIIFAFSQLIILDSKMALIILAVIPVFILVIFLVMKLAMPKFLSMQKMLDKMNKTVKEKLISIKLIKSFCREDFEQKKFNFVADDLMSKSIKAFSIVIFAMPTMIFLLDFTTLIFCWIGGYTFLNSGLELVNF